MPKTRIEAFSDGVIAILITIMVLELHAPHSEKIEALVELVPTFSAYVLSFIFLGIYWNNHHHLFQTVHKIGGDVMWPNLHLLFWLSLVPFTTSWMGETSFESWPVAVYGVDLLMCAVAYTFLSHRLKKFEHSAVLEKAMGKDFKGKFSLLCYLAAIPLSFLSSYISLSLYILVAAIWFCPDQRIEKILSPSSKASMEAQ